MRRLVPDALFISRAGELLTARAIRELVKKYLEQAQIPRASVQTCRHTMAVLDMASGEGPKSVQEMLGHESIETTEGYGSLAGKLQRKRARRLPRRREGN